MFTHMWVFRCLDSFLKNKYLEFTQWHRFTPDFTEFGRHCTSKYQKVHAQINWMVLIQDLFEGWLEFQRNFFDPEPTGEMLINVLLLLFLKDSLVKGTGRADCKYPDYRWLESACSHLTGVISFGFIFISASYVKFSVLISGNAVSGKFNYKFLPANEHLELFGVVSTSLLEFLSYLLLLWLQH